jgi:osmotically-inducible protein OsmY
MKTLKTTLQWAVIALLAGGVATQLACQKKIDKDATEIKVNRDGSTEVERESRAEQQLEQAGREAKQEGRELGEQAQRGAEKVGEQLERGAQNVQRSLDEAKQKLGPVAREVLDDAAISARVKARLMADPDVDALYIDVDTVDGRVTLNGKVPSAFQRDEAERLAQRTEGVREVVNLIQVAGQPRPAKPPARQ